MVRWTDLNHIVWLSSHPIHGKRGQDVYRNFSNSGSKGSFWNDMIHYEIL